MTETEQEHAPGDVKHKEEFAGRITSDSIDRDTLRSKLETVIGPLDPTGHPNTRPINIVIGKLAHPAVNIHQSLHLGRASREAYEQNLRQGFMTPSMQVLKRWHILDPARKPHQSWSQTLMQSSTVHCQC